MDLDQGQKRDKTCSVNSRILFYNNVCRTLSRRTTSRTLSQPIASRIVHIYDARLSIIDIGI